MSTGFSWLRRDAKGYQCRIGVDDFDRSMSLLALPAGSVSAGQCLTIARPPAPGADLPVDHGWVTLDHGLVEHARYQMLVEHLLRR